MPFRRDAIALLYVGDEPSDLDYISSELMPDDERRLAATFRPRVPVVDVNVGSANTRATNADEYFVLTDSWLGDILQFETGCR